MKQMVGSAHMRRFSFLIVSIGVLLIITSLIGSLTIVIALSNGDIAIRTLFDVRVTVFRLAYYSILPLIGGILLVVSGTTLMDRSINVLRRSEAASARQTVDRQKSKMLDIMLNDEEKQVLGLIRGNNSGVLQSNLVIRSGFSKVKMHRILKKLENLDLIRRGRAGITNRVFINSGSSP